MLLALADVPRDQLALSGPIRERLESDEAEAARLAEVDHDPSRLDKTRDTLLLDRLLKVAESDAAELQTELFRLRIRNEADLTPAQLDRKDELVRRSAELGSVRNRLRSDPAGLAGDADSLRFARELAGRINGEGGSEGSVGLLVQGRRRVAELEERAALASWLAGHAGVGDADARTSEGRAVDVMLGLDLSDGGPTAGADLLGAVRRHAEQRPDPAAAGLVRHPESGGDRRPVALARPAGGGGWTSTPSSARSGSSWPRSPHPPRWRRRGGCRG